MDTEDWTTRCNQMDIFSLNAFANIKGGFRQGCKDVYFIRAVGTDACYIQNIEQMDRLLAERELSGQGCYSRIPGLPRLVSMEDSAWYGSCYERFRDSGWTLAATRKTEESEDWQRRLGKAYRQVLAVYRGQGTGVTASMEKNFAAKLFFWFDHTGLELAGSQNPGMSVKLVVHNISRKQEYLFCYLLTLAGIDVLLLQSREDIGQELERLGFSKKLELGDFCDIPVPEYEASAFRKKTPSQRTQEPVSRRTAPVSVRRPERDQRTLEQIRPHSASANRELEFEELAMLASSVVMIAIHNENREIIGTGSGIMIGRDGYILTNYHVASGGRFYSVRIEDDEQTYATDEIVKYNSVLDLAVIRIDRQLTPLPVYQGEKKLVRGQKVVAIGSPLGMFNSVSDGIISGFRHFENVDMIQFTAPTSHGSSGGAVLNMYGEVIGISTAGMDDGQNINLAVGYEWINHFIRGLT